MSSGHVSGSGQLSGSVGEVIGFIGRVLEQQGALVERPAPGHLDVMLPEWLQRELGLDELAFLVADEQDVGGTGIGCGYGSETLSKLAHLALGAEGRVVAGRVDLPQPAARLPNIYQGLNLAIRPAAVEPAAQWLLIGLGRYQATCDDQREGLLRAAVSAQGIPMQLPGLEGLSLAPIDRQDLPVELLRTGFERLSDALAVEAISALEAFREAVARRHRRDAERVDRYFTEVAADLQRRLGGKRDLPGLRAKLQALPAERERRRAQLALNHALEVKIELVGLVALQIPGLTAQLEVRRRKHKVMREVHYDGLAGAWLPLGCDGCGKGTSSFAMCDDAVHVLCAACWDRCGSGGHRSCMRCAGKPLSPWWQQMIKPSSADRKPADRKPVAGKPVDCKPAAPTPPSPGAPSPPGSLQTLQQRVVAVLQRHRQPLTSGEIRQEIDMTAEQLRKAMAPLISQGLVAREGQRRGTRYRWRH